MYSLRRPKPSPRPRVPAAPPARTGRGSKAAAALVATIAITGSVRAAVPTAVDIDSAIDRGRQFLYAQQNADGTWDSGPAPAAGPAKAADKLPYSDEVQYGGHTALAVYALLEAGENPTEPKLQKAIKFLHTANIPSTYGLSLKCQVWADLPATNDVKQSLRRDAAALIAMKKTTGPALLVWDFYAFAPPRKNTYTLSSTQNAAWGLWAASEMDYEVPAEIWKQIERTFETGQNADGSWSYLLPSKTTPPRAPTMFSSATGLSALYLAQDYTRADAFANARGNATNPAIEKGLAWIANNFDQQAAGDKTGPAESQMRRNYGVEHVGLASGLRRFGNHDWYELGSEYMLKAQSKKDGNWGRASGTSDYRLTDTCWAMLFLQRGRVPVAFNKLDYSTGVDDPKKALWNQRPRDVANATAWIERALERELRWQTVDTNDTAAAFLEAPVLYVSGGDTLALKPETKAKLKAYVENGGLILAHADGGNANFARSVERLGAELFPASEWRDVPDSHPLFSSEIYKRSSFKNRPVVRAIGNGVREFVLLIPSADPARTWQLKSARANGDAWQLVANVLAYATDKSNFYPRGTTWLAGVTGDKPARALTVARLHYNGPWDPEPAAWKQLANYAAPRGIAVNTVTLDAGQPVPAGTTAVYVTGATAFAFDDATRTALKTYMDGGGCVIFEAAGGSPAFATSAQTELTKWYGADALQTLAPADALYAGDPLAIAFRPFALSAVDQANRPQLRGVEKDGKPIALLSREDLSAGLLGVPTDGIVGYTPQAARALLLRVLANLKH